MKSVFKGFVFLLVIIFCALLLYQNHQVLVEKKTFFLFSDEIFGFSYGVLEMPLLIYFIGCVLAGAFFMAIPSFALWFSNRRLKKEVNRLTASEEEPEPVLDSGEDLAYHIKEDEAL